MLRIACLLALCIASVPARAAAEPTNDCAHSPLPAEPWTSWRQSGRAVAGGEVMSAPRLTLGKPVLATLRPSTQVQFLVQPSTQHGLQGGLFTFVLKKAARVGIALSTPARIEIVTDRIMTPSIGADEGPDCSGILSIRWFDLPEGAHVVQISGAKTRLIRVMAADATANQP